MTSKLKNNVHSDSPFVQNLLPKLQQTMQDNSVVFVEQLQALWSGYGSIVRCYSKHKNLSYIVKYIQTSNSATEHPRGWNTDNSHQRKVRSYQIETEFYRRYSSLCAQNCKVPALHKIVELEDGCLLVMEDLHASGYNISADKNDWHKLKLAITWLANFHSTFMFNTADGLWSQGGYWHLDTRQDELAVMPEGELKQHATKLDRCLTNAKYQTLIHGDAKFENLCFHTNECDVAAVDFQYVGKGAGVVDLAYLAGSALEQTSLEKYGDQILELYLKALKLALTQTHPTLDFDQLSAEYSRLYPIAWADFYRFLLGWNPNSWKVNPYIKEMTTLALS
ncbi:phosphotransferase [Psychrosphaera aquimarina]|uniref:Phosphotransferase n=1 Tax=Psychrosphaera aquimarina TaxID=2044854 RepID=A0ABU3R2A5_9GAMM|nr:phosphotransferase [Psychrosphaera aquimarina]MDU0113801.1 phosphotransferase [Psychrosphaera aquimarina]